MPFSVNKYRILQVSTPNENYSYEIDVVELESVQCFKDLGATILPAVESCRGKAGIFKRINKFFKITIKLILPLYIILMRHHLEHAVQFWAPQHMKGVAKLELVLIL